ncbi:MAG: hypothetical protein IPP08_08600 [Chlorobiota bacterium]|nr:hypothetical protein [Chlorobiota bacterium]QQS65833.1 MAG: hypothetical protein IPP08_08600 [Chlorobiota bacterium]
MKKIIYFVTLLFIVGMTGCKSDPPVTVSSTDAWAPKVGDYFKYNVYDLDSFGIRVLKSKTTREWKVTKIGQEFQGLKNVSIIDETLTDTTNTPKSSLVYLSTPLDGKVYQYAALNPLVTRFAPIAPFADSIPKSWLLLNDFKSVAGFNWLGQATSKFNVTFPAPAGLTSIELTDSAFSKGKIGVTVPLSTYATSIHVDHKVKIMVKPSILPTAIPLDDLTFSSDGDITNGFYKFKFDSKMIIVPGIGEFFIPGYEMELVDLKKGS